VKPSSDRIGRNSIDVQQTVERFQSEGIRLVVLQLGNLDLTSFAGVDGQDAGGGCRL